MSLLTPWGGRLKQGLRQLLRRYRMDGPTTAFAAHNRQVWGARSAGQAEGEVLVDLHELHPVLVAESYLLPMLAERHGAKLVSHSVPGREPYGLPGHRRAFREVLESIGVRTHIRCVANREQVEEAQALLDAVRPQLRSREALLALQVHGVNIGMDVYESYLRWYRKATVELDDPRLEQVLRTALELLVFWEAYLREHPVRAVVSSHDTYVEMNTILRIAWRDEIPVYVPRPNHIMRPRGPLSYGSTFPRYPELFKQLPEEVREAGMARARRELEARLQGGRGGLVYMENLAFRESDEGAPRVLADDGRPRVVVFSHCFSDAPHVWGGMLFPDFVEWLRFVAGVARETDYHWYLKCHPACEEDSLAHLRELGLVGEGAPFHLIPSGVSHPQLVREGMTAALTAYGTVGHELPLLGVPVVNAGYNPHVAYDFTRTPRSREEYRSLLLELPSLRVDVDPEAVREFYFMHNYRVFSDDLVYPSFRGLMSEAGGHDQTCSSFAYERFLASWTPERHEEIRERIRTFLESNAVFSWESDDPRRLLPLLRQVS